MKPMNPLIQTAVQTIMIAAPALIIGMAIGHIRALRPKRNKPRYPYSITR